MQRIRYGLIVLSMLLCFVTSAKAQVSIGIGLPNVSIGINLPLFPELVPVPGYPVYYAPQMEANYFFYDGMYWVYQDDNWYASSWYNGPWWFVEPEVVPLFVLRVPVRYYRQPPVYFRGWQTNAPPRWGQHWGYGWEQRRRGWDRWQRSTTPSRAPLPVYQRQYSGDRYPTRVDQQHTLRDQSYRYQPRDRVVRQHFQQQVERRSPAPAERERHENPASNRRKQDIQYSTPRQQGLPEKVSQPQQRERAQRAIPAVPQQRGGEVQEQRQRPGTAHREREQQAPRREQQQGKRESKERDRGHGQGHKNERERDR